MIMSNSCISIAEYKELIIWIVPYLIQKDIYVVSSHQQKLQD